MRGCTMKDFSLLAIGAAAMVSGCVAYPVDTYHDRGERGAYRESDRRHDSDHRRDERRERDRDRRDTDNDRDGDRR